MAFKRDSRESWERIHFPHKNAVEEERYEVWGRGPISTLTVWRLYISMCLVKRHGFDMQSNNTWNWSWFLCWSTVELFGSVHKFYSFFHILFVIDYIILETFVKFNMHETSYKPQANTIVSVFTDKSIPPINICPGLWKAGPIIFKIAVWIFQPNWISIPDPMTITSLIINGSKEHKCVVSKLGQ